MLSERHYEYRARKCLDQRWLQIKHRGIAATYDKNALVSDSEGVMVLTLLALTCTLFNIFLCMVLPQQKLTIVYGPQAFLLMLNFALTKITAKMPWVMKITGPLSLLALCLANSNHEYDSQVLLY